MEDILKLILEGIKNGGPEAFALVGWGFYVIERFYIGRSKDKEHKDDIKAFKDEYKATTESTTVAITQFTVLLEVIKDRLGRNSNGGGS